MSEIITHIVLPTRPQPDTIVAIFLLQTFGEESFPGVRKAIVMVDPNAAADPGKLLLDVGGGELDHHDTEFCATELVAKKLNLIDHPALRNLIAYARRDDTEGKGTVSKDPIDRAFGLSGLIAALNKKYLEDPYQVVSTALPLLEAHFQNANEHYVELPKLVAQLTENGMFKSHTVHKPARNTKVAFVITNHIGLAGYLRSNLGGNYRMVAQRRSSGHVNILTKQNPKIDLSQIAALLRLHEANLHSIEVEDESSLFTIGNHPQVPNWYYDPATNSLLNGGVSPDAVEPTKIEWPAIKAIILRGLQGS